MPSIIPFTYHDQPVRVVTIDGEPWFVLADLCKVLDIAASGRLAARLDEGMRQTHTLETAGGRQRMTIVSEAGMYEVVIRSDKPEAAAFRRWITSEVLPSIRKHGGYLTPEKAEEIISDPDVIIELAQAVKRERSARISMESLVHAIEASDGITLRQFHKHYFSDVPERVFFEKLYSLGLLIDQRHHHRNDRGEWRNGPEHRHPSWKGKPYIYLHGSLDGDGVRRESPRVRPGHPEHDLARLLSSKGLQLNTTSDTHREITA